jgi:hypothetical protein
MRDYPLENAGHQLTEVLAMQTYAATYAQAPQEAKERACQVFGLPGDLHDELLLGSMLLLQAGRFTEGRLLLLKVGLACPQKIDAVYRIAASVFKYFNAGMPIRDLAEFGVDLMLQLYQAHPGLLAAQRALLDLLLYFGCADDADRVLGQVDPGPLLAEREELARYRLKQQSFVERCKLSIALITYQRPQLLRHTLTALRQAMRETDFEIVIGVNDDWQETREIVEAAGIAKVIYNRSNTGINLYQQLFDLAEGRYLLEIDDDVAAFPPGFDLQIMACLEARPDLGLVGHWPVGFVDAHSGQRLGPAEALHARCEVAGLPFGLGPVAGVCAGMRRCDYLMINGLSRATLSRYSGEEPQLIRKLALYGRQSGVIFDQGLLVYVDH